MDLSSGNLLWPTVTQATRPGAPLVEDLETDVLVIGAGITGALVADHLSAAGVRVVVIDRRPAVSGSTEASTALINYELDVPLSRLAVQIGEQRARRAYWAAFDALTLWEQQVHGLEGPSGFARRPSLYLAASEEDMSLLEEETAARIAAGFRADLLDAGQLRDRFGVERPGAILTRVAFEVNPLAVALLLLQRAVARGARLHTEVEADFSRMSAARPYTMPTTAGHTIRADWIVIASGYEAPEAFASLRPLTCLKSTYVIATAQQTSLPWKERAILWDSGHPYIYGRTTPDGRAILGGEDEEFADKESRDALLPAKCSTLGARLEALCAGCAAETEFCWTGTFAESIDGLPFIGNHPQWSNILFSLGYGGNGMNFGLIAARMLRDIILGKAPEHADLFSVTRPARALCHQ